MQAIELAGWHGWTDEPVAGVAYVALGMAMISQGRLEEGERALEQAERTLRAEAEPAAQRVRSVHLGASRRVSLAKRRTPAVSLRSPALRRR